jgi:hypothetical protein
MAARLFLEEQVMTAGSFCPVGQRRRVMSIIRKKDRISVQVGFNGCELSGLMVVSVEAVVKENVHIP